MYAPWYLGSMLPCRLFDKAGDGEGSSGSSGDSDKGDESSEEEDGDDDSEEEESDEDDEENEEDEEDDEEDDGDGGKKLSKEAKKRQKDAVALYELLENPQTRNAVLRTMAENAGLLDKSGRPKGGRSEEDVEETMESILAESLGDYKFLAPKLSKAFDKILSNVRQESASEMNRLSAKQTEQEVDSALASLRSETKGESKRFEAKMAALAEEFPKGPSVSMGKYVKHLYTLASAERSTSSTKKRIADSINRNRTDVGERISSGAGPGKGSKKSALVKGNGSFRSILEQSMAAVARGEKPPKD